MSDTKESEPVTSQPRATAQMNVGGNKNALNREFGTDGKRGWSYGLFDCFSECGLCLWATFVPCVVYGKNKQRIEHLRDQGTPLPGGGESVTEFTCIHGALTICGNHGWILQISNRSNIRTRYDIRGDTVGDCLTSWLCNPCALTQERREIELEEGSLSST